jgi:hypothetical protein
VRVPGIKEWVPDINGWVPGIKGWAPDINGWVPGIKGWAPHIKGRASGGSRTPTSDQLSLGEIIGRFKSYTTTQYISGVKHNKWKPLYEKLWQRG